MDKLKKKYGLFTGIAMVVGIVIGSGIFFKAPRVLELTNGKLIISLLTWLIGGIIMVISTYCFALVATKVQKVNGVVDYVEAATNKKVGYAVGWYFSTVYYPILVGTLGFVTMGYFYSLCGFEGVMVSWHFWMAVVVLICLSFLLNTVAPKIAGHYQISTTVIKLIPIFAIAIIGTVMGLVNGNTAESFKNFGTTAKVRSDFGGAILATVFAYEGWVVATSINAELRNAKRNLPIALVVGSIIVVTCYLLYYIGLSSLVPSINDILNAGDNAPVLALSELLGNSGEFIFTMLVLISCLGTLNGLTMGCSRGMYSVAYRGQGIKPDKVAKLHPKYNTSIISSLIGLGLSLFYVIIWIISFTTKFTFLNTMDELTIAFVYISYIFIYLWIIKTRTDLRIFSRYIMPVLAIIGAVFLVFTASGLFTLFVNGDASRVVSFAIFVAITGVFSVIGLFSYKKDIKIEQAN